MNIAEILDNCEFGLTLYSPICGECKLEYIIGGIINVRSSKNVQFAFYSDGTYVNGGEVLIFPSKDQRDWSKFEIPTFKPGDMVEDLNNFTLIYKNEDNVSYSNFLISKKDLSINIGDYCLLNNEIKLVKDGYIKSKIDQVFREKGYQINSDFKLIEKYIPRLSVGDTFELDGIGYTINKIVNNNKTYVVTQTYPKVKNPIVEYFNTKSIDDVCLVCFKSGDHVICKKTGKRHKILRYDVTKDSYFTHHGLWIKKGDSGFKKDKSKFDPYTLEPFQKVLVRTHDKDKWRCDFFSLYDPKNNLPFQCVSSVWTKQCIPYNEDTKYLRGKVEQPNEYYTIWIEEE